MRKYCEQHCLFFAFFFCFFSSIFHSQAVFSLDVDEKLTLRILSVSESKKTILINRGLEDGLVVDNHAKFFLTSGVIARGIVIKASPTRSIWSVYRLVAPDQILKDRVLSLKVTSPVKLTQDPSKILNPRSFFASKIPKRVQEHYNGIPIDSYGRENLGQNLAAEEKDLAFELAGEKLDYGQRGGLQSYRTIEVFGTIHFNGLSTTTNEEDVETFSGKQAFSDIMLGAEKYFRKKNNFFHRFSLLAYIHRSSAEITDLDGDEIKQSVFEYGVGMSWHFGNDPLAFGRVIGFVHFSGGMGTATDEVSINRSDLTAEDSFEGSSNFFLFGIGAKYYTAYGFGVRMMLDYYRRAEEFEVENESSFSRVVSGPRLQIGMSYRW